MNDALICEPEIAASQKSMHKEIRAERSGGKFLTFFLEGEEYGIGILKVQEIFGMMPITCIPKTPDFIRGIINLRGKIIPVIDLRAKFGMPARDQTMETCIVVVQLRQIDMGIIVDRVSEVLSISGNDIEDAPLFGSNVNTDYILGIGKAQGKVKILLDIDQTLSDQEINSLLASQEEGIN